MASKRGKIDELYDFSSLEEQHKKVMGLIAQFVETANNVKPIAVKLEGSEKTKEVIDGIKQVGNATQQMVTITNKAINEYGQLVNISQKVSGAYEDVKQILEKYTGTLDQNMKLHAQYKVRLEEISKTVKEQKKAYDIGLISQEQYQAKLSELTKEQTELKVASGELMQTIKSQIKENQAAAGSYDELNAVLGRSRDLLRQMSDEEKNSAFGQMLTKQVQELDAELKKQDATMGNFQRNVGNYAGAFSAAFETLKQELQQVRASIDSGAFKGDALAALQRQEALLAEVTEGLTQNFTSARQEARAFQEAAAKIGVALGQDAQAFQAFKDSVGEGVDTLGDIRDSIKLAASDTKGLDQMISSAQALAGAYGIAQGASALFGQENEELQKTFVKLQAVMTILSGLQSIQAELTRKDSVLRKAYNWLLGQQNALTATQTRLQQANTVATEGAAKATRSWGMALKATGIGLLLTLLPLLVSAMQKAAEKADELRFRQKALNEINQQAADAVAKVKVQIEDMRTKINLAKEGVLSKTEVLKEYNEGLGKSLGSVKSLNEAEQELINKADAYIEYTWLKAQAEASYALAIDESSKQLKARASGVDEFVDNSDAIGSTLKNITSFFFGTSQGLSKVSQDLLKTGEENQNKVIEDSKKKEGFFLKSREDFLRKAEELKKKYGFKDPEKDTAFKAEDQTAEKQAAARRKAEFEVEKQRVQDLLAIADQIAQNEKNSFNQRLEAEQAYYNFKKQLLDQSRAFELSELDIVAKEEKKKIRDRLQSDKNLTEKQRRDFQAALIEIDKNAAAQKLLIDTKYNSDVLALNSESEKRITALTEDNAQKRKAIREKNAEEMAATWEKNYAAELALIEAASQRELRLLAEQFNKGKISKEKYEEEKLRIENEARKKSLLAEIAYYEKLLTISNLSEDKKAEAHKKLQALRDQLNQEEIKAEEDKANKKWEINQKFHEKLKDLAFELKDTVASLLVAGVEREQNEIQEQIDQLELKKQKQIEVAEQTSASAQEAADKVALIEARAAAERNRLEIQQRKLAQEKARYERASQIASIIGNTAKAVAEALPNIPLSIVVGAIGAAQLVRLLATPIPKYKEGVDDHPGGLAVVGDGGVSEYVVTPEGEVTKTPAVPTLMDLPKKTKVFKDEFAFMDAMMAGTIQHAVTLNEGPAAPLIPWQQMEHAMDRRFRSLERTIKNIPQPAYKSSHPVKTMVHGYGSQTHIN